MPLYMEVEFKWSEVFDQMDKELQDPYYEKYVSEIIENLVDMIEAYSDLLDDKQREILKAALEG